MTRRIAVWAGLGFVVPVVGYFMFFYHLNPNLSQPAVQALIYMSCPIVLAAIQFLTFSLWTVAALNALTYLAIGTIVETLRRMLKPLAAV